MLTGRRLDEMRDSPRHTGDATSIVQRSFLTVVSDAGAVRSFELSGPQVRLLDITLHSDVNHYLELLDANRNQGLRASPSPTTEPAPATSSSPPLRSADLEVHLPHVHRSGARRPRPDFHQTTTLQGWSVVDNTTASDWINVELSLRRGEAHDGQVRRAHPYETSAADSITPSTTQPVIRQGRDTGARELVGMHSGRQSKTLSPPPDRYFPPLSRLGSRVPRASIDAGAGYHG
jgi:hypothetical protein